MLNGVNTLAEWAKLVSTSIHVPYLCATLVVLYLWFPATKGALQHLRHRKPLNSHEWLVLGVSMSFFAKFTDGLYWELTWFNSFYRTQWGPLMVDHGSVPNIPLRAIAGFIAAYCHAQGYQVYMQENGHPQNKADIFWPVTFISALVGVFVFAMLMMTHPDN